MANYNLLILFIFEPEISDLQYIALHGAHIEYDDTHEQNGHTDIWHDKHINNDDNLSQSGHKDVT